MNRHDSTPTTDYDADFYAWTQEQARFLREFDGRRPELLAPLDLAHIAEEIEDLGKSELRGAAGLIRNIMVHLIKAASDPEAEAVRHWWAEVVTFHADLPEYYTPSMRRLVVMQKLWDQARKVAVASLSQHGRRLGDGVPAECPFALDDFLLPDFDLGAALENLSRREPIP